MSNEANAATQAPLEDMGHYLVQKNDCLWNIAAKPRVYGDSFEWPLLFKANRDEIRDPDLIYPRQVLRVEKVRSSEEINHAREVAMATPKYVPHSKPRESLPVNYF
jgi:nucleoid-associated protein YgaU